VVFFSLYTGLSPTAIGIGIGIAGFLSLVGVCALVIGPVVARIERTLRNGDLVVTAA
jgi:hypothetical protein